jgi:hypothetical protein
VPVTADARWGKGLLNCDSAAVQLSEQVCFCKASHALHKLWRPVVGPIDGETHRRLETKAMKESRFSPRRAKMCKEGAGVVEHKKNFTAVQAAARAPVIGDFVESRLTSHSSAPDGGGVSETLLCWPIRD